MENENLSKFIIRIFAIVVLLFLGAYCIKEMWNSLIPEVFNGPELTYQQAFVGYCLTKLIFPFNIDFKKLIE